MYLMTIIFFLAQNTLTPAELYNRGNEHYENSDYAKAIEMYEQAASRIDNARLFYNLGNSYFKSGRIGKAILNYRKAQILAPRDSEIKHNLSFVRNYRVDKVKVMSNPIAGLFSDLFHFFSMFETQVLATFLFFITAVFASFYIIYRKSIFGHLLIISAFICTLFFINWLVWAQELNAHSAVIIVPETTALSGPGEDYKEILVIHDGTEVNIRERRGAYLLIQLPGGLGGWVPQDALERIF